jgi:hypothetical protein
MNILFFHGFCIKFYSAVAEKNGVPFYRGVCSVLPRLFSVEFRPSEKKTYFCFFNISFIFQFQHTKKNKRVAKMLLNNTEQAEILKCIYFVRYLNKDGRQKKLFHFAPVSPTRGCSGGTNFATQ